jgi:hypothetical protein
LIESGINVEGDRAENVDLSSDYVSGADLTGYALVFNGWLTDQSADEMFSKHFQTSY